MLPGPERSRQLTFLSFVRSQIAAPFGRLEAKRRAVALQACVWGIALLPLSGELPSDQLLLFLFFPQRVLESVTAQLP